VHAKWLYGGLRRFANDLNTPEGLALSAVAGFDHHISKPVNVDELTSLLSRSCVALFFKRGHSRGDPSAMSDSITCDLSDYGGPTT
jgi:hypothetical protein